MKRTSILFKFAVVGLMGLALFVSSAFATQFKVNYKRGQVYVQRNGINSPLKRGQLLRQSDTIVTGSRSFAAIGGSDGTIIKVSANTTMAIAEAQETRRLRSQRLAILRGKISTHVSKLRKRSRITYETPAIVVAVRGTSFVVDVRSQGESRVYVLSGEVQAQFRDQDAGGQVSTSRSIVRTGSMAVVNEGSRNVEVEPMTEQDLVESQAGLPQEIGSIERITEEDATSEGEGLNQQAPAPSEEEQEIEELKEELRQNIMEEREGLTETKQRVSEQQEWDHTTRKRIGDYNVSQYYRKEGANRIRLISVTENTASGQVSALESTSTYSNGLPSLIDFLDRGASLRADITEARFVSSLNGQRDEIAMLNYKDDNIADQLVIDGVTMEDYNIDKIKYDKFAPEYLITFRFPNNDEDYAFKISFSMQVESGANVDNILGANRQRITSDELNTLISEGLYGEILLDEYKDNPLSPSPDFLKTESIKIILLGDSLVPILEGL